LAITHATVLGGSDNPAYPISKDEWNAALVGNGLSLYNVKDPAYGATGDGVADDTAEINAAIDAANAAGGGIVFIPRGTFLVTGVTLKSNVEIVGSGYGSVIKLKNATNAGVINFAAAATRCGVSHLRVDGNKVNQTEDHDCYGIVTPGAGGVSDSWVRDCWVHDSLRSAIYMEGPRNEASRNYIWSIGNTTNPGRTGIVMSGENVTAGYCRVIGNYIEDCTEYGIKIYPRNDETIVANNVIRDSGRYGIYNQSSNGVAYIGNVIENAGEFGILIQGTDDGLSSNDCSVTGGAIRNSLSGGIILWAGGTGTVLNTSISGVVLTGNEGAGVQVQNAPNTTISGCTIAGNGTTWAKGSEGIVVMTGSTNTTITGNVIRNNGNTTSGYGIWSWQTVTDVTITGNRIFDNGAGFQDTGVQSGVSSDYWIVVGNNLRGNSVAATSLVGANNVVASNIT
jgi:hypothetical protein